MTNAAQNFANHTRYDPLFHFFLLPVTFATLVIAVYHLFRFPGFAAAWLFVMSLAVVVGVLKIRFYALRVQDRVIRLEERIRLAAVLPEPLRSRIGELSAAQFIGLRFASDAELPALVQRALDEKLSRTDIKKSVTNWRPDDSRI